MIRAGALRTRAALAAATLLVLAPGPADALKWFGASGRCEPPAKFYTAAHVDGRLPCTPPIPGRCPDDADCIVDGSNPAGLGHCDGSADEPTILCVADGQKPDHDADCPSGYTRNLAGRCGSLDLAVAPATQPRRPNVILFVGDDQAYCSYGWSRECRSPQFGNPVLSPYTPNLDALARQGTVFPIAQVGAAICSPSRSTILTGRNYQDFNNDKHNLASVATLASALEQLGGEGGVPNPYACDPESGALCDESVEGVVVPAKPYNSSELRPKAVSVIGGYATVVIGKGAPGSPSALGFQAKGEGAGVGRTHCTDGSVAPKCGSGFDDYSQEKSVSDPRCLTEPAAGSCPPNGPDEIKANKSLFEFIDSLLYPTGGSPEYAVQPFFAWYAPKMPHKPVKPEPAISSFLFTSASPFFTGGHSGALDEEDGGDPLWEYYGMVHWSDDALREIRKYLQADRCVVLDTKKGLLVDWTKASADCPPNDWVLGTDLGLADSTVIIYLADHGRMLPDSKRRFSHGGYTTSLLVYDPREAEPSGTGCTGKPDWNVAVDPECEDQRSPAWKSGVDMPADHLRYERAHAIDLLPTVVGYAVRPDTVQPCPDSYVPAGENFPAECKGKDLREHLWSPPVAPATTPLRNAVCGYQTKTGGHTQNAYLLGRAGVCVGALCNPDVANSCEPTGTAPNEPELCLTGDDCAGNPCEREARWCRNDHRKHCVTDGDCETAGPIANRAVCEPRLVKYYAGPNGFALVDLFIEPDEGPTSAPDDNRDLIRGPDSASWAYQMTTESEWADMRNTLRGCLATWTATSGASTLTCDTATPCGTCPPEYACD